MNHITHTTLAALAEHNPYQWDHDRLLAGLGKTEADDEPLALVKVLEVSGLLDALWCINQLWPEKLRLRLACRFARQVEKWMPEASRDALAVFERYAEGAASEEEFRVFADVANATRPFSDFAAIAVIAASVCNAAAAANNAAYANRDSYSAEVAKQTQILRQFLAEMEGGAA